MLVPQAHVNRFPVNVRLENVPSLADWKKNPWPFPREGGVSFTTSMV